MKAICLLGLKPNQIWIEFLNKFKNYDIYIMIDDSKNYTEQFKEYKNVKILHVPDKVCEKKHFSKTTSFCVGKRITSWDRALYYFSTLNKKHKYVWFIEEDVFFNSEKTLADIDKKYPTSDLLSSITKDKEHSKEWYHWNRFEINLPEPHYKCMCCAVRMSQVMLSKIKQYVKENKQSCFLEAFFPTLCISNNLKHDTPKELDDIVYRKEYTLGEINKTNLFHPFKDAILHTLLRNTLKVSKINNKTRKIKNLILC